MLKNRLFDWVPVVLVPALLLATLPVPAKAETPQERQLVNLESVRALADEIASGIQAKPGGSAANAAHFFHIGQDLDDPRLRLVAEMLAERGIRVKGTLVTPDEMVGHIETANRASQGWVAHTLPMDWRAKFSLFLHRIGKLTLWSGHIEKLRAVGLELRPPLISALVVSVWFIGALWPVDTLGKQVAVGVLFAWVAGLQTIFPYYNSLRRQWRSAFWDEAAAPGMQLATEEERTYSRIFFAVSAFFVELVICTAIPLCLGIPVLENKASIGWTALGSVFASMPAEAWAGTYTEKAAHLNEQAERTGNAELAQQGQKASRLSNIIRAVWWRVLFCPMKNATQLQAMAGWQTALFSFSILGSNWDIGSLGFAVCFSIGMAIDTWKNQSKILRSIKQFFQARMRSRTAPVECKDLILVEALADEINAN